MDTPNEGHLSIKDTSLSRQGPIHSVDTDNQVRLQSPDWTSGLAQITPLQRLLIQVSLLHPAIQLYVVIWEHIVCTLFDQSGVGIKNLQRDRRLWVQFLEELYLLLSVVPVGLFILELLLQGRRNTRRKSQGERRTVLDPIIQSV